MWVEMEGWGLREGQVDLWKAVRIWNSDGWASSARTVVVLAEQEEVAKEGAEGPPEQRGRDIEGEVRGKDRRNTELEGRSWHS